MSGFCDLRSILKSSRYLLEYFSIYAGILHIEYFRSRPVVRLKRLKTEITMAVEASDKNK